jgi:hypothetical protein
MTQRQGRALGPHVRQLMESHSPPLEPIDLQRRLGISQSATSRKLSGERGFDLHELIPLAELLDCDVHDLLMGAVHSPDPGMRAQEGGRASTATTRPSRRKRDDSAGDTHWFVSSGPRFGISRNVTGDRASVAQAA